MKDETPDAAASFASRLRAIAESLEGGKYDECLRKNIELTHFSYVLHHKDWIFLCEVLESVYNNMAELFSEHDVPDNAEAGIREKLHKCLGNVIRAYDGGDEADKYRALRDMRAEATVFQLNAVTAYPARRALR